MPRSSNGLPRGQGSVEEAEPAAAALPLPGNGARARRGSCWPAGAGAGRALRPPPRLPTQAFLGQAAACATAGRIPRAQREAMEAPGAGGQEPEAGAAGATGSGPIAAAEEEEIDLSLDDIIKRNKKGQASPKRNRWRQQQFKNRNPAYGNGKPRFRSWVPRNLQGPNRFRGGFRKQQYYRKPFWNGVSSPGQRAAIRPNGVSPLNRPASAQQGKQDESALSRSSSIGPAADTQRQLPTRVQRVRMAGASPPAQRPFRLNRKPPFFQRQSRFNFSRQRIESNADRKPSKMRRWQLQPSSGAVLTVSVSNPQASQMNMPGAKRPFLRGRNTPAKMTRRQPKGVPLRFNFRAMANQTSLTLNERFSGLRNKRQFTALRDTDRMVTLP